MESIGKLLLAVSLFQLFPTDAAVLEDKVLNRESEVVSFVPSKEIYTVEEIRDYPVKVDQDSLGIVTSAESAIVVDAKSGMVLLAEHPDQVRAIGSVTKLMAAMVFLDSNPDLSEIVSIDYSDLVQGGRIYLAFRDALTLEDVFAAALVGSDNTAAHSLMRFSGISEEGFVARMNEKAHELGMYSTRFEDATGLGAQNMSTARDLVRLLEAAGSYEEIVTYSTMPSIGISQRSGYSVQIENTNGLLLSYLNQGDYRVEAGKTGYLPQAGYVLASTVRDTSTDEVVHVVVLGSETKDTRVDDVKGLAAWAFNVFEWP